MSIYSLGNDRMLCWDDFAIAKSEGIEIKMHKPTPHDLAIIRPFDSLFFLLKL